VQVVAAWNGPAEPCAASACGPRLAHRRFVPEMAHDALSCKDHKVFLSKLRLDTTPLRRLLMVDEFILGSQGRHWPTVNEGVQKLRGQKRIEMKY
jgi:hypothetical protein